MTPVTPDNLLSYSDIVARQRAGFLRASEIPVEYIVSLPVPTLRAGEPGFAFFACATSSVLIQPLQQGPPDRWWVVSAKNGHLALYALCRVVPFPSNAALTRAVMPAETRTLPQIREDADAIERQMNALASRFFAGEAGDAAARKALLQTMTAHLKEPVMPYYRALAPDFCAWLDA